MLPGSPRNELITLCCLVRKRKPQMTASMALMKVVRVLPPDSPEKAYFDNLMEQDLVEEYYKLIEDIRNANLHL